MDPSASISLLKATHEDLDFLVQLRETTMRVVVSNHYPWDDKAQLDRVLVNFDSAKIVFIVGVRAGLLKVVDEPPHIHLSQIQLLPEFQGLGIGSHLVKAVIHEGQVKQKAITLHVFKSNPALALYCRLGFKENFEDQHSFRMIRRPDCR